MARRLIGLLCFSLVLSSATQAQIWPASGLWWQPGSNGKFMQLNIGPGGYALVTLSYSDGGLPTSRILQGQLQTGIPAVDGHFARLESPLYRVDDAGCLSCDDRDGRTVTDNPAPHRLSFADGTSARLLLPSGQEIRYEYFPLVTRVEETAAVRYANSRRLLLREGLNAAQAQPNLIQTPRACEAILPAGVSVVRFVFDEDRINASRLSRQLRSALLAIESGISPTVTLLSASSPASEQSRCQHQGCSGPAPGGGTCKVIASLSESSVGLAGYFDDGTANQAANGPLQVIALD